MFRFEFSEHLVWLILIPVMIGLFMLWRYFRNKSLSQFGSPELISKLMPSASRSKPLIKFVLMLSAVGFLIVGLANPQWGTKKRKYQGRSVDVFVALDISHSMLATDASPNRLERARHFARDLIRSLKGERIGFVIFAGNAYLQMPLTNDYAAAELFVKSANPNMAPSQGTAISDAIDLVMKSNVGKDPHPQVMVVITDGENHDEVTLQKAKEANEKGLTIFSVGVGTEAGSFMPVYVNGRQDYKRDNTGNPIRSKINVAMLQDLAAAGKGGYYNLGAANASIVTDLQEKISRIEKREMELLAFSEYESYFQYFLGAALLLLLIEFLISRRKSEWLKSKDIFSPVKNTIEKG